jgi:hypothetical protein
MAAAFVIIALILIDVSFRNTQGALGTQLESDLPGFAKWAVAIMVIGALQWIPGFTNPAKALLALVLIVVVVVNKGAFSNFVSAVEGTPASVSVQEPPEITGTPEIDLNTVGSNTASTATSALGSVGSFFSGLL